MRHPHQLQVKDMKVPRNPLFTGLYRPARVIIRFEGLIVCDCQDLTDVHTFTIDASENQLTHSVVEDC